MKGMEYANLGNSGLKVSKLILGCMGFGSKSWAEWVKEDEETVFKCLKHAYDQGMRTWDTADMYSNGESERWIGKFLKQYNINRSSVVIMSKCYMPIDDDPALEKNAMNVINRQGLSRKHIMDAVDASVERLGTYIDVLQIHRLDDTPKQEIMRALDDAVRSGKVHYLGASSMRGTDFAELQFVAEKNGWTKFVSMQNLYNLLYREEERDMIPFCKRTGVAIIPWSPYCMGYLCRPVEFEKTDRSDSVKMLAPAYNTDSGRKIIDRVEKLASKKGIKMAQVAAAWVLYKGAMPIVGCTSTERIDDAIAALKVTFSKDEVKYLEECYEPRPVIGFQ